MPAQGKNPDVGCSFFSQDLLESCRRRDENNEKEDEVIKSEGPGDGKEIVGVDAVESVESVLRSGYREERPVQSARLIPVSGNDCYFRSFSTWHQS